MKICRTAAFMLVGSFTCAASAALLSPADRDIIHQQQQQLPEQSHEPERATPLVRLDGKPTRALKIAFPGLKDHILNLRSIEQGMEQINRLRSQPVQIENLSGDKAGYSIINLTATPELPLTGSLPTQA